MLSALGVRHELGIHETTVVRLQVQSESHSMKMSIEPKRLRGGIPRAAVDYGLDFNHSLVAFQVGNLPRCHIDGNEVISSRPRGDDWLGTMAEAPG